MFEGWYIVFGDISPIYRADILLVGITSIFIDIIGPNNVIARLLKAQIHTTASREKTHYFVLGIYISAHIQFPKTMTCMYIQSFVRFFNLFCHIEKIFLSTNDIFFHERFHKLP